MVCGTGDLADKSGDLGAGSPLMVMSGMGERGGSGGNLNDRSIVPVRRDFFMVPSPNARSEVGRSRDIVSSCSFPSSSSSGSGAAGGVAEDGFVELGGGDAGREGVRERIGCD